MKIGRIKEDLVHGRWAVFNAGQIVVINAGEGVPKDQYSVTIFKPKEGSWGHTSNVERKNVEVLSGDAKRLFYLLFR
jgi:hypothetical protein